MRNENAVRLDIIKHQRTVGLNALWQTSDHWLGIAAYHEHYHPQYAADAFRCAELREELDNIRRSAWTEENSPKEQGFDSFLETGEG